MNDVKLDEQRQIFLELFDLNNICEREIEIPDREIHDWMGRNYGCIFDHASYLRSDGKPILLISPSDSSMRDMEKLIVFCKRYCLEFQMSNYPDGLPEYYQKRRLVFIIKKRREI